MKFFQIFYKRGYTYVSIFNFNVNFISPWGRGKSILKILSLLWKYFIDVLYFALMCKIDLC